MFNYAFPDFTKDDIRWAVAERMHNERLKSKLTLDSLADKLNSSKPTVQSWEKDWKREGKHASNTIPSWDQLLNICNLYHCDMGYILCEYDEHTRDLADVSIQTGLTEESASVLKHLFEFELNYPASSQVLEIPQKYLCNNDVILDDQHRLLLLVFANYLICNLGSFSDILDKIKPLALLLNEYEHDPDRKIIQEGIEYILNNSHVTLSDIASSDSFVRERAELLFHEFLLDVKGYAFDLDSQECRHNILMGKFLDYHSIFDGMIIKQFDFLINNTFLDITKQFFTSINDQWNGYQKFLKTQRIKKH